MTDDALDDFTARLPAGKRRGSHDEASEASATRPPMPEERAKRSAESSSARVWSYPKRHCRASSPQEWAKRREPRTFHTGDNRFAPKNPRGRQPGRQFACDSCCMLQARRRNRLPEFDGQYVNRRKGGPEEMKRDWKNGHWDATWYCTSCSAQLLYNHSLPLSWIVLDRIRKKLGIVTRKAIARAKRGKRRWGGGGRQVVARVDAAWRPRD